LSIDDIENLTEQPDANYIENSRDENIVWLRNLVEEQKTEIQFLKKTVAQQMDLLQKLTDKKMPKSIKK
ncbi:MAG: hypothetical protein RI965_1414, partial [Bacteroidota bacterium]